MADQFKAKLARIRLLVLDVDGVLTDGKIYLGGDGTELKTFYVPDGSALIRGLRAGLRIAWISGRDSPAVSARARELGVKEVYQGVSDKVAILEKLRKQYSLRMEETAALGDDLVDLPICESAGFSAAVADAHPILKKKADYVTIHAGGEGAVREVIDLILENRS